MRTSKADKNYLSLNNGCAMFYAGTVNLQYLPLSEPIPKVISPEDPLKWDAILKCSNRHDTTLTDLKVAQGQENSLDINNKSSNLDFSGDWGVSCNIGDQVFTIKGASHDIKISGNIYSDGKKAVVVIGEWSDQSYDKSYNIDLSDLKMADGSPVTVIVSRVNNPILAAFGRSKDIKFPKNFKVLTLMSLGEQIYWWAKWLAVKAKIIK